MAESGGMGRRVQSNEKFLEWLRHIQGGGTSEKRGESLSRGHSPDEGKPSSQRAKSAPSSPGAADGGRKAKSVKRRKSLDEDGVHTKRASGKSARKTKPPGTRVVRNKVLEKVRGRRAGSEDSREGSRKRGREEAQEDAREDTPEPSLKGVKQSRRIASRKKDKKEEPILKMPRLQVTLSRQEIMDDFIAITGKRPQGKPKKSLILAYGLALCSSLQAGTTARYY